MWGFNPMSFPAPEWPLYFHFLTCCRIPPIGFRVNDCWTSEILLKEREWPKRQLKPPTGGKD